MKGRSCLPNDPKIIVCICFGAFWICNKMLFYGRITVHLGNRVFTHTRWLFSCCSVFRPDARGDMLFDKNNDLVYIKSLPKVLEHLHYFLTHRANSPSPPPPPQNNVELIRDYSQQTRQFALK